MNYIHHPNPAIIPPATVPFVAILDFDHQDFATFPDRTGFRRDGHLDIGRPADEIAAFAQTWLFFGLIETCTSTHIDKDSFVDQCPDDPRSLVVKVTRLDNLFQKTLRQEKLDSILEDLRVAAEASDLFDLVQTHEMRESVVFLSIKLLITHLISYYHSAFNQDYCFRAFNHPNHHRSFHHGRYHGVLVQERYYLSHYRSGQNVALPSLQAWCHQPVLSMESSDAMSPAASYLVRRLKQHKWCPHQARQILCTQDYYVTYYLSSIPRQEPATISHHACSGQQCIAYNTNDDTYETQHVDPTCNCTFVNVPEHQLHDIVVNGGIPLVRISLETEATVKLHLQSHTGGAPYTAISHVWIDGLGNPKGNALPTCQLRKLAMRLNNMAMQHSPLSRSTFLARNVPHTTSLVWLDTLCVPVGPACSDLRIRAINQMPMIYTSARQVLVLDSELERIAHEPSELVDAHILISKWNTRCWTLQEGALVRKCLFQTRYSVHAVSDAVDRPFSHLWDGLLAFFGLWFEMQCDLEKVVRGANMRNVYTNLHTNSISFGQRYLRYMISQRASESMYRHFRSRKLDVARRASVLPYPIETFQAWNRVGQRSTTKMDDLHIILANLTDLRASDIYTFGSPVERTKALLYHTQYAPVDLLFNNYPRPNSGDDSDNRWIPSFPTSQPLLEDAYFAMARNGLVLDGDTDDEVWIERIVVRSAMRLFRFSFDLKLASTSVWYKIDCTHTPGDNFSRDDSQDALLVLTRRYVNDKSKFSRKWKGARLVVQSRDDTDEKVIKTRYDCPLTFVLQDRPLDPPELLDYPPLAIEVASKETTIIIQHQFDESLYSDFAHRSQALEEELYKAKPRTVVLVATLIFLVGAHTVHLGFTEFHHNVWVRLAGAFIAYFSIFLLFCGLLFILTDGDWFPRWTYDSWRATFVENWTPRTAEQLPRVFVGQDQRYDEVQ